MRYTQLLDPFKNRQPEMTFSADLAKPLHTQKPIGWNSCAPEESEIDFSKIELNIEYTDELLITAYEDFGKFLAVMEIEKVKGGIPFSVRKGESECFEAYTVEVSEGGCVITAADTEGVRRALVYVEDEMQRREGARLPVGTVKRKPYITERVSRCYFTPASTVATEQEENELCDEIDYYPDEYLNRLAHDGINALWLGATLQYLVKSDIIPEYAADCERRMKKLNSVIEKCRRYGIKTYLFSVDPASSYKNEKLKKNHPDLMGDEGEAFINHLCPSTEKGLAYIKEAITRVFTEAPGLSGYINLSVGEAESHCGSTSRLICKRCIKKFGSNAKVLNFVEKTIAETMAKVAPNAKYVSWTYAQRSWPEKDIEESCLGRDKRVSHLINFEDLGREKQLGKDRLAYDYWLSYAGPGKLFTDCHDINKKIGVDTWAKIQTCSSHEISTVPYVPVPALLYDKYKYMHENGIHGVMQCWFFGNYPSLMNKAAGELSFEPFLSKEEFLKKLAGVYWGKSADAVAKAWTYFAEGYKCFPIGVDFEWYSPMQDSPCAPYHLKPIDLPLPATWLLDEMVGGDRIGDCILDSHTLDEVLILVGEMSKKWDEGLLELEAVKNFLGEARREQLTVAKAISLIFKSGLNTFKFYSLRRLLGIGRVNNQSYILAKMADIVREEIDISRALIPITKEDNRIGYHSEAHGYKIFPEKLEWRISEMEKLLKTEFPEVKERIERGLVPLKFYYGLDDGARKYEIRESDIEKANRVPFLLKSGEKTDTTRLSVAEDNGIITLRFYLTGHGDTLRIDPEFNMFHRTSPMFLKDGELWFNRHYGYSLFDTKVEEKRSKFTLDYKKSERDEVYTVSFKREDLGMSEGEPFRIMVSRDGRMPSVLMTNDRSFKKLVVGEYSPDAFAFIIPKNNLNK